MVRGVVGSTNLVVVAGCVVVIGGFVVIMKISQNLPVNDEFAQMQRIESADMVHLALFMHGLGSHSGSLNSFSIKFSV